MTDSELGGVAYALLKDQIDLVAARDARVIAVGRLPLRI